jgi:hypothetical protein
VTKLDPVLGGGPREGRVNVARRHGEDAKDEACS